MTESLTCHCGDAGCDGHRIRVSIDSQFWRRKFSRRSCRDSNSQPFDHESGTLNNKLSIADPLWTDHGLKKIKMWNWCARTDFHQKIVEKIKSVLLSHKLVASEEKASTRFQRQDSYPLFESPCGPKPTATAIVVPPFCLYRTGYDVAL